MKRKSFLAEYGPRLLSKGYPIVPIKPGTKYPGFDGWQKTEADETKLARWLGNGFKRGGVGVLTRELPAVDLDVQDPDIVEQLVEWCEDNLGQTVRRVGSAPKQLLVFRTDEPFAKVASDKYGDFEGREHKVEILGDGQQFVAYATHPDTRQPYEWVSELGLADTDPDDLPTITEPQARALVEFFESIKPDDWEVIEPAGKTRHVDTSIPEPERVLTHAKPKVDIATSRLEGALSYLDPDMRMHGWVRVGMALFHQYGGDQEGFRIWDEWSAHGAKYEPKEMRARWRSFEADLSNTNPVTVASIIRDARANGWAPKKEAPAAPASKFALIHAKDVLAKLGPINWRIKGFLEENTTGLFFGDPGSFKSFIALDMAFHVAAGKDWHGNAVKQGTVIYIAGEGHGGLARRFAAWEKHHGIDLSTVPLYASEQAAQFYNHESAVQVVSAINAIAKFTGAPAMIVIDTLARNFGPGDENSNNDMGQFLNHVDGLLRARFGATVAIVHHTGHTHKQRARGATALKGGMDFEYRIESVGAGMVACMTCTKMKDAREPADQWFEGTEIHVGGFDGDEEITSLIFEKSAPPVAEEPSLKGKQAELFEIIVREVPLDRETLRNVVLSEGVFETPDQFKRALQELKKKGVVIENDGWISTEDAFFAEGATE
ncbi:MAG: AAA family ATPase [Roseibium sp.]|nr:AAA family ATPase [Roseibium sp.]